MSRLPIFKIIFSSIVFTWEKREQLFQGLWLPALLGLCLTLYESLWAGFGSGLDLKSGGENPAEIFIWLGLLFSATVIVSTRSYQILLAKSQDGKFRFPISWGLSETKFTLGMFGITFMFIIVLSLVSSVLMLFAQQIEGIGALGMLMFLPSIYLAGRFMLVFPAVCTNDDLRLFDAFKWSWMTTRKNGAAMLVLCIVLPVSIAWGIDWLGSVSGSTVLSIVSGLLVWISLPFEIAFIALSYTTLERMSKAELAE